MRSASRMRHTLGSTQEYQSLPTSAIFVRLLDRTLPLLSGADQFDAKVTPGQWLGRGVTDV